MRLTIDPTSTRGAVTVKADALVIDLDEATIVNGIAEAAARAVADGARAAGWVKTGELADNIRASGGDVTVPADRLSRDPELAAKFRAAVPAAAAPLDQPAVKVAVEDAVRRMISIGKGR